MKRVSKNRKLSFEKLDLDKLYSLDEASELVKDITTTKFDASGPPKKAGLVKAK